LKKEKWRQELPEGGSKMFLKSIEYTQYEGTPKLWKLEGCTLGNINLIVGKNATGKSKTLSIINSLASLLSGERAIFITGNYKVKFDNKGQKINYYLHYENSSVVKEELIIDSEKKLTRGKEGIGEIYYAEKKDTINFQTPPRELASVARRDTIQHPFLEDLYNWSRCVRYYRFGTQLGKEHLAVFIKNKAEQPSLNPRDTDLVIAMFREGREKYSEEFTNAIMNDMNSIGYSLDEIGINAPESLILQAELPTEPVVLYVKETDLDCKTDQLDMSQGMFRALSLMIQIHYSLFTSTPSCILIDDIGEGLDFERSSALVKLLIERAKNSSVQLIMATNDRFIMNSVPLEYWLVVQRIGGKSKIYNRRNSPQLFKDFELTGLNNFDFFSSGYYLKGNRQN
jgi:energy-coupling factor transporter ATP-binding protein EcfA2